MLQLITTPYNTPWEQENFNITTFWGVSALGAYTQQKMSTSLLNQQLAVFYTCAN